MHIYINTHAHTCMDIYIDRQIHAYIHTDRQTVYIVLNYQINHCGWSMIISNLISNPETK